MSSTDLASEPHQRAADQASDEARARYASIETDRAKVRQILASESTDLVQEGDVAADYLESLLDILDLDGDLDMDVEGERAVVAIVGKGLGSLVGDKGETLEALQELTRLAVQREMGVRSRLMLDIGGFRAKRRAELADLGAEVAARVAASGEPERLRPMTPFERKVVHDAVAQVERRAQRERRRRAAASRRRPPRLSGTSRPRRAPAEWRDGRCRRCSGQQLAGGGAIRGAAGHRRDRRAGCSVPVRPSGSGIATCSTARSLAELIPDGCAGHRRRQRGRAAGHPARPGPPDARSCCWSRWRGGAPSSRRSWTELGLGDRVTVVRGRAPEIAARASFFRGLRDRSGCRTAGAARVVDDALGSARR